MPDPIHASSGEWSVEARAVHNTLDPHPERPPRWSVEIKRHKEYAGSAFFTLEQGVYDVRVRRAGKRDTEPFPAADLADQLRKAVGGATT